MSAPFEFVIETIATERIHKLKVYRQGRLIAVERYDDLPEAQARKELLEAVARELSAYPDPEGE